MLIIKGFAPNTTLINNQPGSINPVGELSPTGATYSTEKGYYSNNAIADDVILITFACTDDGDSVILDPDIRNGILTTIKAAYDYAFDHQGTALNVSDYTTYLLTLLNEDISDLTFGVIADDSRIWIPSRISFTLRDQPANRIDIWLADQAFRNQYPLTEIKIVPPFMPLDDFFLAGSTVEARLRAITPTQIAQNLQTVRAENPETFLRIDMFDYNDANNSQRVVPAPWGVLVYGITGNSIDAIREALINYILENSSHDRDDWADIFPDIFRRHEFVITPAWLNYAIPNKVTQAGVYSPFLTGPESTALARLYSPEYLLAHVQTNAQTFGFPHRSLAVVAIGHIENRGQNYKLTDYFPDWINTNTNQDFNRMTERTREWSLALKSAVEYAEDFTLYDNIPMGYMKVIRNDRVFLTFTFENVNYLVLCKASA